MREIKFRGTDWETGEYVYGDLLKGNYDLSCPKIKPRKKRARYVKDVVQLVGCDVAGKEIYEGDTVVDNHGNEYTVYLRAVADGELEFSFINDEFDTCDFKLKEATS